MAKERTAGVESARRVLNILLMFSETTPEVTLEEVMTVNEISQASAYRYLSLLGELGLLKLQGPGTYVLSARVQRLAAASEQAIDLETLARPTLRSITEATRETTFIMKRGRDEAIFVAQTQPDRAMKLSFQPGSTSPLHRGAVAKILLAYSPERYQQAYLAGRITDATERQRLMGEMDRIRERGYAESLAEVDEGIWGGAVPVLSEGELIASLSVAGPAFRISDDAKADILERLKHGAQEIARQYESGLGYETGLGQAI
jgi:DNA-binding IclR family transcriptional regulator